MYKDYHLWIYFIVSLELYTFIVAMGVVTNCSDLILTQIGEKKAPNFVYSRINIITRKSYICHQLFGRVSNASTY